MCNTGEFVGGAYGDHLTFAVRNIAEQRGRWPPCGELSMITCPMPSMRISSYEWPGGTSTGPTMTIALSVSVCGGEKRSGVCLCVVCAIRPLQCSGQIWLSYTQPSDGQESGMYKR